MVYQIACGLLDISVGTSEADELINSNNSGLPRNDSQRFNDVSHSNVNAVLIALQTDPYVHYLH